MNPKISACMLVLLLLAGVCLAADKVITDGAIADTVQIKLASDMDVRGSNLKVDVKQGVVTLSGIVVSPNQRDRAAKLAKKVKGVKSVNNLIEVRRG